MDYKKRREEVIKLRSYGNSLQEIGKKFNISRQRVYQIINNPPRNGQCFACGKMSETIRKICSICFNKYFNRESGGCLEGLDYIRECVRIRDKHTCQECGKVWKKGQRRFDVHHLDGQCGKKSQSYDRKANMDGLTTLCHKCHLNLDEVRHKMSAKSSPRPNKIKSPDLSAIT